MRLDEDKLIFTQSYSLCSTPEGQQGHNGAEQRRHHQGGGGSHVTYHSGGIHTSRGRRRTRLDQLQHTHTFTLEVATIHNKQL